MYALFKIYIGKKNCFEAVRVNNCTVNIGASYYDLWLVHRVIIIFCFELCMVFIIYIYSELQEYPVGERKVCDSPGYSHI